MRLRPGIAAFALGALLVPRAAPAQDGDGSALASYRRARVVLDAALAAHGGAQQLRDLRSIQLRHEGRSFWRNQSPSARPPWASTPASGRLVLDLAGSRAIWESRTEFPGGFHNHARHLLAGRDGWTANFIERRWFVRDDSTGTGRRGLMRFLPPFNLLTALDRSTTLRHQGEARLDGRLQDVISYSAAEGGTIVSLHVDRETRLLSRVEQLVTDPRDGDAAFAVSYFDYRVAGGIPLPTRRTTHRAGDLVEDLQLLDLAVNAPLPDSLFVRPAGFEDGTGGPAADTSLAVLAPGVWLVRGVAGSNNALAVAFDDHLMVIEAYGNEAASRRTLETLRRAAPSKPVRYVVATHHHDDHTGGIRAFIAESIAVVTTPGNREFFEQMARGRYTLAPDRQAAVQAPLRLELVTGKRRVFRDGTGRVELIDMGPSPHADEMLVAWLPKERLLVQGDLYNRPADGRMRAGNLTTRHFLGWLERSGLDVERIVPVHGPPLTVAELREAVRLMERAD